MRITHVLAVAVALALLTPPAAQAETRREAKLERQVAKLKRQTRKLERSRDRWEGRALDAETAVSDLAADLPTAIRAVPLDQFFAVVLTPAREAWPCDSFYEGDSGYWSLDFVARDFCP